MDVIGLFPFALVSLEGAEGWMCKRTPTRTNCTVCVGAVAEFFAAGKSWFARPQQGQPRFDPGHSSRVEFYPPAFDVRNESATASLQFSQMGD
jgi:hypothetical protein